MALAISMVPPAMPQPITTLDFAVAGLSKGLRIKREEAAALVRLVEQSADPTRGRLLNEYA